MTDRRRPYRRAASAIPTEIPEHEGLTPPPISIEDIDQLSDDTTPPPLKNQLRMLASGLERVWGERTSAARLDRIDAKLGDLALAASRTDAVLGELRPQLDRWRAATDDLTQQLPKLIGMVEGLTHHVRSIDARMRDLELEVRSLGERSAGQADDLVAAQDGQTALVKRVHDIEQSLRDKSIATVAIAKRDKWWFAGLAAVVGFAAANIRDLVQFLTK